MKIIDEKGRLFGKINVIDFSVILFLLTLTPMFYFGYKIFRKKPVEPKVYTEIEINCKFIKVKPEVLKLIAIGDKDTDNEDTMIGEIIWLGETEPYQYKLNIGGDAVITREDSELKEIYAKLKLKSEIKNNILYCKDKQIAIGSPIDFKTNKYTITFVPLIEKEIAKVDLEIYVVFKELTEDVLKQISIGDKELDEKGEVAAEILSIGKIDNSTREINLGAGNFALSEDSYKKQVNVKVRLRCQMTDKKELYFKNKKVLEDSIIEFKTSKYNIRGKIAKTYETAVLPVETKLVQAQVKFAGMIPELSRVINEGDIEKNPKGEISASLEKILSNKPSDVLVLREDKWMTLNHPFNRDILVIIKFLCMEKEGILYFKNYPVKMGNSITFTTDLYSVTGTIVSLEIK